MSSRLGIEDLANLCEVQETVEKMAGIPRPRPGLGMMLDSHGFCFRQPETFDRAVIEVDMGQHRITVFCLPSNRLILLDGFRSARSKDREAMILGSNLDHPGFEIFDRVV